MTTPTADNPEGIMPPKAPLQCDYVIELRGGGTACCQGTQGHTERHSAAYVLAHRVDRRAEWTRAEVYWGEAHRLNRKRRQRVEAVLGENPFNPWDRDPTPAEQESLLRDGLTRESFERDTAERDGYATNEEWENRQTDTPAPNIDKEDS
jgi:hypothetical protein